MDDYRYEQLAQRIMFTKSDAIHVVGVLEQHGLQYRKGKDFIDLCDAVKKALKNGRAKTEFELSMLEVYLKQILKPIRSKQNA